MHEAKHNFVPRHLIFKLQQEFLKFNDICVSWSFPKTGMETDFSNLENRSFENVNFSQEQLLIKYYLLICLLL